jgi:3'(2'), 5'-bisphosphate nucleotidase
MVKLPPASDGGFARWLAVQAGDLLVRLREELGYGDPDALRAAGDKYSHELIVEHLGRWRPADAVLSEEGADDPARLNADRVWIVDPLDGTREFGEAGRTDWAVHIGLWGRTSATIREPTGAIRNEWSGSLDPSRRRSAPFASGYGRLVAGAVALPAQHRVFSTDIPPAYPPIREGRLLLAASRTRAPEFLTALAEDLGADLHPMGSAGAKIAAVVDGTVDAYVHAGGQYEWDSAAPVAVATATGLHASRIDGSTLEYNRLEVRLPDLVVCRKDLAPRLLAALTSRLEGSDTR